MVKWRASSNAEAEKVLKDIANSGANVLKELDIRLMIHRASNESRFDYISEDVPYSSENSLVDGLDDVV